MEMEMEETVLRKFHLREWKKKLENENKEYLQSLENFRKDRVELQAKRDVLFEIALQHKDSESLEDFKIHSGFFTIDNELKKLQSEDQLKIEESLSQKVHFNKIIIDKINLSL